jgi:hypothetical protein
LENFKWGTEPCFEGIAILKGVSSGASINHNTVLINALYRTSSILALTFSLLYREQILINVLKVLASAFYM